ncbi:MAG: hypothetical protein KF915_07255 [Polyangiaceae bacterium]|nr:hypothetical protein [Polyangiaceae bacterium]
MIEKIQAAIGQTTGERPRRAIAAPAAPRAARPAGPAAPARRSKGKRGGKRTPEELGQMAAAVLQFVENNPNANIEEIGRGVGLATKDLALPVRKLLKEGRLKKRGEKRATRYNAGGRGGRVA